MQETKADDLKRRREDAGMNKLIKYWPVIISLVMGIITIASIVISVQKVEPRVCTLEQKVEFNALELNTLKSQYPFIIEGLKEIKSEIQRLHRQERYRE